MLAAASSSSIAFVPCQIMVEHNSAAAKEDSKERRKEKKDKKKRCSDSLELDRADACSQRRKGQGRDVLLRSIAAFLDSNGFSKTLSMLLSEAELESGCWKSSTVNLEGLFCKFLDSSSDITEGNISLLNDEDLQKLIISSDKVMDNSSEKKTDKKKRKRKDQVDGIETETNKKEGLSSEIADLSANELAESHEKFKGEKKKNKMLNEIHDEIAEPDDSRKLKEIVKAKEEELISLANDSFESSKKIKSEKKKDKKLKQVEQKSENISKKKSDDMNLVGAEGHTWPASEDALDNGCQDKIKKKKKKSKSDVVPNLSSDHAGGEKMSDPVKICDTNHDVTVEDLNTKGAKKTSKKRKVSDLGEKSDVETASKVSKVKSEGAEINEETVNLVMFDKSTIDCDTQVITKEKKMKASKENAKVAEKKLDLSPKRKENANASNSSNEALATQLENASIGKKEKCSAEPKSATPFQRVNIDDVSYADNKLKDNSYWAKDGADTGYGAKAQEVLGQVRGRDFRHEKTKKKRGSYRGGQIDQKSYSIKFNSSDSE